MKYKKTRFVASQEIHPEIFLCSEFNTAHFILLSKSTHDLYTNNDADIGTLQTRYPDVFNRLVEGNFLVKADKDEIAEELKRRIATYQDRDMLHLIVNPTLDCNLSCWYCYENKIPKSRLDQKTEEGIIKYIEQHYASFPFSTLKFSFFGGEPFMRPESIKNLAEKAETFCKEQKIHLILDFTTNGTLCSEKIINFLKDYSCVFQITLDGNKEQHNRIKHTKLRNIDTFSLTLRNIRRIQENIPDSHISIRINFDKDTLSGFDSILEELKDLDRMRTQIILKRIWQVDAKEISYEQVYSVLHKLFENDFSVDYYSQGGICFADRRNQVTFNYDGNVFKCTTINKFDEEASLGKLNPDTGEIHWYEEKIRYLDNDTTPKRCRKCKMLPDCTGPCRRHVAEGEGDECFLDDLKMSIEDYALMQFRIELVKQRIKSKHNEN